MRRDSWDGTGFVQRLSLKLRVAKAPGNRSGDGVSLCQGGAGLDEPALRGCEKGVCHLVIDWLLATRIWNPNRGILG